MNIQHRAYRGVRPHFSAGLRLQPDLHFDELVTLWTTVQKPAPKTIHSARRAVRRLTELFGNIAVGELHHAHLFKFRNDLDKLPRSQTRSERAIPLLCLVELLNYGDETARNSHQSLVGYAYAKFHEPDAAGNPRFREAACFVHWRRDFHDIWTPQKVRYRARSARAYRAVL